MKKKGRKNESYDLWLATSKEKGIENRKGFRKAGFSFIDLFFLDSEMFLIWTIKKIYKIQPSLLMGFVSLFNGISTFEG